MPYVPTSEGAHGREEELQWARVVAGDQQPARGVALIFIQKLCTAFHEFEPAWQRGALNPESLDYFRGRLGARGRRVLQVLEANDLDGLDGSAQLRELQHLIQEARSLQALAELAEPVHAIAHTLAEALESAVA